MDGTVEYGMREAVAVTAALILSALKQRVVILGAFHVAEEPP